MSGVLLGITLLVTTVRAMEFIYFGVFIACAAAVYMVLARRADKELPRKTVDQIFFFMLGLASLIWFLSKMAPSVA